MKPPRSVAFQAAMPPFVGACFFRAAALTLLALSAAVAQPGQLLGPAQQSRMQDSNLKPALPGALQGVGIDQRLYQQVSLDLMFKDEA